MQDNQWNIIAITAKPKKSLKYFNGGKGRDNAD